MNGWVFCSLATDSLFVGVYSSIDQWRQREVVYRRFLQFWLFFPHRNYKSRSIECKVNFRTAPYYWKEICFFNGNILFLSLISLSKNWMHNIVSGCAEIFTDYNFNWCWHHTQQKLKWYLELISVMRSYDKKTFHIFENLLKTWGTATKVLSLFWRYRWLDACWSPRKLWEHHPQVPGQFFPHYPPDWSSTAVRETLLKPVLKSFTVVITASKCKRCLIRPTTSPTKAISKVLMYNDRAPTKAMKEGIEAESRIISEFEKDTGLTVHKSGFVISETHPFLGASPDGIIDNHTIVEVKNIQVKEGESHEDAMCRLGVYKKNGSAIEINKNHGYYHQIQQQLFCTQSNSCHFIVSSAISTHREVITFDSGFWNDILPKLENFYFNHLFPELVYPRIFHSEMQWNKVVEFPRSL